jgi:hypothetical protein
VSEYKPPHQEPDWAALERQNRAFIDDFAAATVAALRALSTREHDVVFEQSSSVTGRIVVEWTAPGWLLPGGRAGGIRFALIPNLRGAGLPKSGRVRRKLMNQAPPTVVCGFYVEERSAIYPSGGLEHGSRVKPGMIIEAMKFADRDSMGAYNFCKKYIEDGSLPVLSRSRSGGLIPPWIHGELGAMALQALATLGASRAPWRLSQLRASRKPTVTQRWPP